MDGSYHRPPPENLQPPVYDGGSVETPYTANRLPPRASQEPTQPDLSAPRWPPPHGYDGQRYGFRSDFSAPCPGGGGFGGPPLVHPYGFDPSVPPPPFGCPPPGHFPHMDPTAPVNAYSSPGAATFQSVPQQLRPGPHTARYEDCSHGQQLQARREYDEWCESGAPLGSTRFPPRGIVNDDTRAPGTTTTTPEDETTVQRKQDQQWLRRFLQSRNKTPKTPQTPQTQDHQQDHQQVQHHEHLGGGTVGDLRQALYRAAELVSQLALSCETLRINLDNECAWKDSYSTALEVKRELQDAVPALTDSWCSGRWRAKLSRIAKRRAQRLRARKLQQAEEKQRQDRISDREAAIDTWRMQQIRQVEEKKKEQELKLAADAVLCEVRKKQADVKRMQDLLRSLEKLRRLRKEAASRKGIVTEHECEEAFNSRLEQLRCVLKRRTAVYSAEEKALKVMLEGEQEEERRREREKRAKKERERLLQKKRRAEAALFGDELPADSVLLPFKEYYTQAEHSLQALLQIRREWDVFVVAADHPDGSPVPQSWILPDPPSDRTWASAVQTADTE